MLHAAPTTAPVTNTDRLARAAHRLMQAERTGDQDAIRHAAAYLSFYERQVTAEAALERVGLQMEDEEVEAQRQHNEIGYAATLY